MDLLKIIKNIILDKSVFIVIYIANTILLTTFCYLLSWNIDALYAVILSAFMFCVYLMYEAYYQINYVKKIKDAERSPDYYEETSNSVEKLVFTAISNLHENYNKKLYTMRSESKNKDEIFSTYIHNMKTSVSVVELAINKVVQEHGESNEFIDIREENKKLADELESALNILRIEEFDKDYITENINLSIFIKGIVNKNKRLFIYNGIFPIVKVEENINVHTDLKWCEYMIEQLLNNAIKYTNKNQEKNIFITAKEENEEIVLSIKDEGVGIPKEDIGRVFQPFYTGKNGRCNKKSTGIGLYMVKAVSRKLNHDISINSTEGEGTEVNIIFRKLSKL